MDFLSPEFRRNPYPVYDGIRSASPLIRDPRTGLWVVFDYEGAKRAVSDHDAFSSSPSTAGARHPQWMIFADPPLHTKLRALIMRAFTPAVVANLEPRIVDLSRALLDPLVSQTAFDLAESYSVPLPMMVIAEMIGIPAADWQLFKRWSDAILQLSYTMFDAAETAAAVALFRTVTGDMIVYIADLIAHRKAAPQDDLLTKLVAAEVDGEHLSNQEILDFIQLLLVAGNETTTNLINNAVLCLIENPGQLARLRSEPALLPSAIEEVLRYRSPFQWIYRTTRREVEMHGQVIPANKFLLPMLGSANRDPRVFPDPNRFDIGRDPNPHIAFSHGIHFCLGAPLSRLEARIALAHLIERFPHFELASSEPWEPRRALNVLGPTHLRLVTHASR